MSLNLTQFALTNIAGEPMNIDPTKISARIVSTSAPVTGYLQGGDFITYNPTEVGALPVVQQATNGASADGMIVFNAKKNQYNAYDVAEVAINGSIMTAIAGAAINRGDKLNYVPGTAANKAGLVYATSSANYVGESLSIATAAGDLVQVRIITQ